MFNMVLSNALSTFTTTHSTSSQTKNHSKNETACSFPFCGLNQKADPTHWRQKRSRLTLKRWGSLTLFLVDGRKRGRKKVAVWKKITWGSTLPCVWTLMPLTSALKILKTFPSPFLDDQQSPVWTKSEQF